MLLFKILKWFFKNVFPTFQQIFLKVKTELRLVIFYTMCLLMCFEFFILSEIERTLADFIFI